MQSHNNYNIEELKIPVPWGHIAAKLWNNTNSHSKKILCIHGWLDNANSFDTLIPLLPQKHSYLAIDLPGHGKSSHLPIESFYYFSNWILDVFLILKHLNWSEKITLIGHSMGAGISLLFASSYPEMIDKVVSLDIVAPYVSPIDHCQDILSKGIFLHLSYMKNPNVGNKPYTYDLAISRLLEFQSLNEKSAKIMLERGMTPNPDNSGTYIMNRDMRLHYRTPMYFSDEHWKVFLKSLNCPIMVVIGEDSHIKSDIVGEKRFNEYKDLFKVTLKEKFIYKEYKGTHHLHMNSPELISADLTKFLEN